MAAVESDLIDLTGVSLEALRSMDSALLATPVARLLRKVYDPQGSASTFNPQRYD